MSTKLRTMAKHPKKGVAVIVYYRRKDSRSEGTREGIWDGAHWLTRDIYSEGVFVLFPGNFELIGWRPYEQPKK